MAGLTPQEFVGSWRDVTLKDRSASQSHLIDFCRLLNQAAPAATYEEDNSRGTDHVRDRQSLQQTFGDP